MGTRPFTPAVVGALAFALIGLAFGAAAGWVARRNGLAAGGRIGRTVAEAFSPLSEGAAAALACGVDGALFLGLIGFGVGLAGWTVVLYAGAGLLALAVSAAA